MPQLGRTTTLLGQGIYLAKHASYSRLAKYAVPDSLTGSKFVIVVTAAIGEICDASSHTQTTPMTLGAPIASPIPADRADTCVDVLNRDDAEIFCCFDKAQVLPQFVIEFTEM